MIRYGENEEVRQGWTYEVTMGSQKVELQLMQIAPNVAISLLMTIDEKIGVVRAAGLELAATVKDLEVEAVASAATLGIPVGAAVAEGLGLERQFVLQKTAKKHLGDALVEPLASVTTRDDQALRLDRRWLEHLDGKRVVFVDDVISSGSSCAAALRLLRRAGARVVAVAALLVEGDAWRTKLQPDADLVHYLAKIPIFKRDGPNDDWRPACN